MTPQLVGDGPLLLVDDDVHDLRLSQACFERSELAGRYRLETFLGPEDALSYMAEVEAGERPMPSIALLDINMPGMSGFELLQAIRARQAFQHVPAVVFVTSSDQQSDIDRARAASAAYQEKFFSLAEGIAFFNQLAPDPDGVAG